MIALDSGVEEKSQLQEEVELEEKKKRLNQEVLYLMQMNQKRRYAVVVTSLAFAFIWVGFIILQSEVLDFGADTILWKCS